MGSWIYLRHYHNLRILFSMLPLASPFPEPITEQLNSVATTIYASARSNLDPILLGPLSNLFPSTAAKVASDSSRLYDWWNTPSQFESVGPSFTLNWDTQQYKCWLSQWITFGLLATLQAVNVFWVLLMFRTLWRGLRTLGKERVDERSVYDSDEERAEDDTKPVFVDVGKSAADVVESG
jgi:acyl-CoA-dependent ceramide synthase